MTLQRLLKWGTLASGVVCLAAGYSLIGQWVLLALALGSGLLVSIIGRGINIHLPFGILVLLVVLCSWG